MTRNLALLAKRVDLETTRLTVVRSVTRGNVNLIWPRCDGLIWPHRWSVNPSRLLDGGQGVSDIQGMSTRLDAEARDEQVRVAIELGSSDPLDQLRGLRAADRQLDRWQRQTITRAREQGSSWAQIGDALGVTKQAAWSLYNEGVRASLNAVRERSGLTDEQAQQLADEERDALRSQ